MRRSATVVLRRGRWRWLLLAVVLLGVVGAFVAPGVVLHARHPFLCLYHGARAWATARHHHPVWTVVHLYRATHDCGRAAVQ
jgi:hypothetical protein